VVFCSERFDTTMRSVLAAKEATAMQSDTAQCKKERTAMQIDSYCNAK